MYYISVITDAGTNGRGTGATLKKGGSD